VSWDVEHPMSQRSMGHDEWETGDWAASSTGEGTCLTRAYWLKPATRDKAHGVLRRGLCHSPAFAPSVPPGLAPPPPYWLDSEKLMLTATTSLLIVKRTSSPRGRHEPYGMSGKVVQVMPTR
jgi:hypothetical protein